jgi:hypothetical protein
LSHALAVRAFREAKSEGLFPIYPGAKIGIALNSYWGEVEYYTTKNVEAASRFNEW